MGVGSANTPQTPLFLSVTPMSRLPRLPNYDLASSILISLTLYPPENYVALKVNAPGLLPLSGIPKPEIQRSNISPSPKQFICHAYQVYGSYVDTLLALL
jgi:hypothetical protein